MEIVKVNDICNFVFKILGATKENGVAILEKRRLTAIAQEKVREKVFVFFLEFSIIIKKFRFYNFFT